MRVERSNVGLFDDTAETGWISGVEKHASAANQSYRCATMGGISKLQRCF
jgi:hypothetical protein